MNDAYKTIGQVNPKLRLKQIAPLRSEQYPRLWLRGFSDVELVDLVPDFEELWNYTKAKVIATGKADFSILKTEKAEDQLRSPLNNIVSIVVPTYDVEAFIIDTLNSIKSQNYPNIHALVVDDCSNDGTKHAVLDFMNSYSTELSISFIQIPKNIGNPGFTRNFGIFNLIHENTSFVTFMDGDDVYADPAAIESMVVAMHEFKKVIAVLGDYDWISESGSPLAGPSGMSRTRDGSWQWKKRKRLTWENLVVGQLGAFHLQCLMVRSTAPYIPYSPQGEDSDYYAKLINRFTPEDGILEDAIVQIPKLVAHYRKRSESLTHKKITVARPEPPAKLREIEGRSDPIPPYYHLAGVPDQYITRRNISGWATRRLTRLFIRDLRSKGLSSALFHAKQAIRDERIRAIDLITIPFVEITLGVIGRLLAGSLSKINRTTQS